MEKWMSVGELQGFIDKRNQLESAVFDLQSAALTLKYIDKSTSEKVQQIADDYKPHIAKMDEIIKAHEEDAPSWLLDSLSLAHF